MERRVLKLAEGVMGMAWKERYGRSWKVWMEWMESGTKIQLFSDTAKFGDVIRKCLNYAFRLKVVKLPNSL